MDDVNLPADAVSAQQAVIGSMLIDERCVGAVLSRLTADDFTDGACKNTFRAIKKQFAEGKPVDYVLLQEQVGGGEPWVKWARELMELTPTAANVEAYADKVKRDTAVYRFRELSGKGTLVTDVDEAMKLARSMVALFTDASRVERMTAAELAQDFIRRMTSKEKPEYLPWGVPTADRTVYAERGDICVLGGYASAGKTLLSIQMALTQAKRYKVGYYTLETRPGKMADRIFAHLAKLSLEAIKRQDLSEQDMARVAAAANLFATRTPVEFIRAAGLSVGDIAADSVAHGYEIIYIDYLQLVEASGFRPGERYAAVTSVSRTLKVFAQRTNTAVVALAQLSRPEKTGKEQKQVPPSMHSFKESGQIEQDADVAFLLWPEDPNDNQSRRVLKLAKNKEGRKFRIELDFNGATQTMVEAEPKPGASVAAQMAAKGRAAKAANRTTDSQVKFRELRKSDEDNPFV